ncbi:MAG: DNA polymerase III subunit delta' [Clostridiaceae bacterium]
MSSQSIIGHQNIKKYLEKTIQLGTLSHAHIFAGEDGIGKSILAKEIALRILGKTEDRDYADIINWRSDKASIGVDKIRELVVEINKKPYEQDKKVIIVYNAETMTPQAQNAFLKTIEEPPKGVSIFLLCENLEALLDTIKSRCQIHKLKKLSQEDMLQFAKKNFDYIDSEELKPILAFADGIPGRIEKFVNNEEFKEIREIALKVLTKCCSIDIVELLKLSEELNKYKKQWKEVLNTFILYIRDAIIYKETGDESNVINIDKLSEINQLTNIYSYNKLSLLINIIDYVKDNLQSNVSPAVTFDVMLLKFQEV